MCEVCAATSRIIPAMDRLLDDLIQNMPELDVVINNPSPDMPTEMSLQDRKKAILMMHLTGHYFARESIYYGVPIPHYFKSFRFAMLSNIFRRMHGMTDEEVKIRTNANRSEILERISRELIVEGLTVVSSIDDKEHITLSDFANADFITVDPNDPEQVKEALEKITARQRVEKVLDTPIKSGKTIPITDEIHIYEDPEVEERMLELLNNMKVPNDDKKKH